jgi:hypothetical protein
MMAMSATKQELLQIVERTDAALSRVSWELDQAIEIARTGNISGGLHRAEKAADDLRGLAGRCS